MNLSNQQDKPGDMEITLIDVVCFFKKYYRTVLYFGIVGIGVAIVYLSLTPRRYEAVAKIQMAQINASNISSSNISSSNISSSYDYSGFYGVSIEQPAHLIARLESPTTLTERVIELCGFAGNDRNDLTNSIKLTPIKGTVNAVEMKVYAASSRTAYECANSLFELIKESQAQIAAPFIDELKKRLAYVQNRLADNKQIVSASNQSGQVISANHLLMRDEIRQLYDEIAWLERVIVISKNSGTRLIAPIYSFDKPATPKKLQALAFGLISGALFGFLIALAHRAFTGLKSNSSL